MSKLIAGQVELSKSELGQLVAQQLGMEVDEGTPISLKATKTGVIVTVGAMNAVNSAFGSTPKPTTEKTKNKTTRKRRHNLGLTNQVGKNRKDIKYPGIIRNIRKFCKELGVNGLFEIGTIVNFLRVEYPDIEVDRVKQYLSNRDSLPVVYDRATKLYTVTARTRKMSKSQWMRGI